MKDEIKEILLKFNKEVEKAELTRNPYSSEDKKFKHILVSLSEEHFNIFKDTLNYITNLEQENERLKEIIENLTTMTVCGDRKQIKQTAQYKLDIAQERIDKAIEYIKENIADIEFMEENYDLDFLNKNEIEVEYKDIKKLIELLEDKYE